MTDAFPLPFLSPYQLNRWVLWCVSIIIRYYLCYRNYIVRTLKCPCRLLIKKSTYTWPVSKISNSVVILTWKVNRLRCPKMSADDEIVPRYTHYIHYKSPCLDLKCLILSRNWIWTKLSAKRYYCVIGFSRGWCKWPCSTAWITTYRNLAVSMSKFWDCCSLRDYSIPIQLNCIMIRIIRTRKPVIYITKQP